MRLGRLDLNLLVALDALFVEGNVTGAARQLNLSQSAMSGALLRLREYFEDELLTQVGNKMVLTPRAEELRAPVRESLMFIENKISRMPTFDPATAKRRFRVAASDYILEVVLAPFLRAIEAEAPDISIDVMLPTLQLASDLNRGDLDIVISIGDRLEDQHPKIHLLTDDHVVISWVSNARLDGGLTTELFQELSHVAVHFGSDRAPAHVENYFSLEGIKRRVVAAVPFFSAIPVLVVGTDRIATMMRRHANHYLAILPIAIHECPFAIPAVREVIQYHHSRGTDTGLRWLVDRLLAFAQSQQST